MCSNAQVLHPLLVVTNADVSEHEVVALCDKHSIKFILDVIDKICSDNKLIELELIFLYLHAIKEINFLAFWVDRCYGAG